MTDETPKPKRVTRPKAGKGDLPRKGGRENYEEGYDRIDWSEPTNKDKGD